MALLFLDGFDKYGPVNTSGAAVAALLTAGEWTTNAVAAQIVAPLSSTGFALALPTASGSLAVTKTLAASYSRLIGGFRFSSNLVGFLAIQFTDAGSNQCAISINSTGTISVRNGVFNAGTVLATSSVSVTANTVHYLEFDITFSNTGSFTVWLDGVAIIGGSSGVTGSGDTTATANNTANGIGFGNSNANVGTMDDFYLFDTSGTTNNAVLLTSPRIETSFPTSDGAVQFGFGAAIIGTNVARSATTSSNAANQWRVRAVTPPFNCTINSIAFLPLTTNAAPTFRPVIYSDSGGVPGTLLSTGSTITGMTANTALVMPLTTPQALTAGTQYWIGYMNDVVTGGGSLTVLDTSSTDRITTSTFSSGAPSSAPGGQLNATSTVIWGNISNPGVNWYEVSRQPPPGMSSYVFNSIVGQEDLYNLAPLSVTPSQIYAVAVKAYCNKSDSGTKTVSMRMKSGSTDSGGSATGQTLGTSFAWLTSLFLTDPNTGAAWLPAALNVAQCGLRIDS